MISSTCRGGCGWIDLEHARQPDPPRELRGRRAGRPSADVVCDHALPRARGGPRGVEKAEGPGEGELNAEERLARLPAGGHGLPPEGGRGEQRAARVDRSEGTPP